MTPTSHSFELIFEIDGEFTDELYDELYEAGCDDTTFVTRSGRHYAEFDRESHSFASAVLSAIADLESVDGVRPVRVESDDLATAAAIAKRVGRTRQSINQLITGARSDGDFPPAVPWVAGAKLYEWPAVASWFSEHLPEVELTPGEDAEFITAINGALTARHQLRRLREPDERVAMASLFRWDLEAVEHDDRVPSAGRVKLRDIMRTVAVGLR